MTIGQKEDLLLNKNGGITNRPAVDVDANKNVQKMCSLQHNFFKLNETSAWKVQFTKLSQKPGDSKIDPSEMYSFFN